MALLPCHPRLGPHVAEGTRKSHPGPGVDLAAVLEERDSLSREAGIDINSAHRKTKTHARRRPGNARMDAPGQVADAYARLMNTKTEKRPFDAYDTGLLLVHAFPERIASARPGNNAQFQLSQRQLCHGGAHRRSGPRSLAGGNHLDAREGTGKIFLAGPLNPRDLAPIG